MTTVAARAELVWGYTMADVERIAQAAGRKHTSIRRSFLDTEDLENTAWDAVVERLYTWPYSATEPGFFDLFTAALDALRRAEHAYTHTHGIPDGDRANKANFTKAWVTTRRTGEADFTDRLCEALALPRALAVLDLDGYEVLVTLAAHNNRGVSAADALGMKYATFTTRLAAARASVLEVWFEGETPVRRTRASKDTECRYGHSRAEHSYRESSGQWRCRECAKLKVRRARAREGGRVTVDLTPDEPVVLTFAPASDDGQGIRTSANTCWCGAAYGHDWPGKHEGRAHPMVNAALSATG